MSNEDIVKQLLESAGLEPAQVQEANVARLQVHGNRVIGSHLVPGLDVDVQEEQDGINATIIVREGTRIVNPVHLCFGLIPDSGVQLIDMDVRIEREAQATVWAHCTFPNAVDVTHKMDARIDVGPGASYSYIERHVHGPAGGVVVLPKAHVNLRENASYRTEFELIKGRIGHMEIDYETDCAAGCVLEMTVRVAGRGDDTLIIRETGHLNGEKSRAVLQSYIALREDARAEVFNTITADADGARGHVDCKEIVQDRAHAKAVPIVDVRHPGAHVTHEAAIGSVDNKQLETLLARGLFEDQAVDLIIEGLLQ